MHTFEETAHGEASRPYKNPSTRTRDEAKLQAGLLEKNFSGPWEQDSLTNILTSTDA